MWSCEGSAHVGKMLILPSVTVYDTSSKNNKAGIYFPIHEYIIVEKYFRIMYYVERLVGGNIM
jgi:hypothetical protein